MQIWVVSINLSEIKTESYLLFCWEIVAFPSFASKQWILEYIVSDTEIIMIIVLFTCMKCNTKYQR